MQGCDEVQDIVLKMENIHKRFSGVYALRGAKLELKTGEVHALLGENGAGKSTLIKILAGIYTPDEGVITYKNMVCEIKGVHDSQAKGISVIHQEICLVPYMTVADNFFLGKEKVKTNFGHIHEEDMIDQTQNLLDQLGIDINAKEKVVNLSIAKQQIIEIAKALLTKSEVIIMDEPTASLTQKEVEMLFDTIEKLKKQNITIVYISHRMEELFRVSDRVTVMRDGEYIGTKITKETNQNELIAMMVGRNLTELYIKSEHQLGEVVLEVKNLCNEYIKNISFNVKKGEILGISGLVGAGRSEVARAIFGIDALKSGEILVEQKKVNIHSPSEAMQSGIALVPENRKEEGLVLIQEVGYNITLPVLNQFSTAIKIDNSKEQQIINKYIKDLNIKTPSHKQLAGNLSGGNQQKIVIAKWLATKPKVLILDEPTRGVDVGAKAEIYAIMSELAAKGVAIIMISSELPEIINMSDRVIVMSTGKITGELNKQDINSETIMKYATGGTKKDAS